MGRRVQHSAILISTMQGYLISMSFVILVSTEVTVIYSRSFLMKMLTILHNYTGNRFTISIILGYCEELITVLTYLCRVIS